MAALLLLALASCERSALPAPPTNTPDPVAPPLQPSPSPTPEASVVSTPASTPRAAANGPVTAALQQTSSPTPVALGASTPATTPQAAANPTAGALSARAARVAVRQEIIDAYVSGPCNPGPFIAIDLWFWENQVRWRADGTAVFFSQGPIIYRATLDGSMVEVIADGSVPVRPPWWPGVDSSNYGAVYGDVFGPMTSFDISPDGERLVYATCAYRRNGVQEYGLRNEYELAAVSLEGLGVERLTRSRGFDNYPSWSPDGTRIAFLSAVSGRTSVIRETHLAVMEPDSSRQRSIRTSPPIVMHPPKWSPDGRHLAVVGTDDSRFRHAIYTVGANGTDLRRLARTVSGPSWSPDGTRLALVSTDEASGNDRILVTMAPDGSQVREVPLAAGWEPHYRGGHPISEQEWIPTLAWSPAGDQLLYTCGLRVCIVALDGTPVGRSPIELERGSVASWSPDGLQIAVAAGAVWETPWLERLPGPVLYTMAPNGSELRVIAEAGLRAVAAEVRPAGVADSQAECSAGFVVLNPDANSGLVRDCEVLIGLRDALFGTVVSNWNPGTPVSQWVGVTVAGSPPRVTALQLPRQSGALRASIPPSIAELAHLRSLSLEGKGLVGPIPSSLSSLRFLEHIDLSSNRLAGLIPPGLGRLPALTHLDLSLNNLTGPIPASLSRLSRLSYLGLSYNSLTGPIPADLGKLKALTRLDLSGNRLTGRIPPQLGQLETIEFLGLSDNRLTGPIPRSLGQLRNLEVLYLSSNQLAGSIPAELTQLQRLREVHLIGNGFTGCIGPDLPVVDRYDLGLPDCQAA